MTNQQDAGEEEWEANDQDITQWHSMPPYWIVQRGNFVAAFNSKHDRDRALADHTAARRARKLEERVSSRRCWPATLNTREP